MAVTCNVKLMRTGKLVPNRLEQPENKARLLTLIVGVVYLHKNKMTAI